LREGSDGATSAFITCRSFTLRRSLFKERRHLAAVFVLLASKGGKMPPFLDRKPLIVLPISPFHVAPCKARQSRTQQRVASRDGLAYFLTE
jgi:hypothetical protein